MINRFLENINLALYYIFNINNSQYFKKLTKSGTKSSIVHNLVTCYKKSWRRRLVLLFTPQWILQGNNGNNESFAMSLSSRYFYSSESFELRWQEKKRNLLSKNSLSRNHNWLIQWLRLSSVSAFFSSNLKIPFKIDINWASHTNAVHKSPNDLTSKSSSNRSCCHQVTHCLFVLFFHCQWSSELFCSSPTSILWVGLSKFTSMLRRESRREATGGTPLMDKNIF